MKKSPFRSLRFTLIEMLTVMAILGVLMAIGLGVFAFANQYMANASTQALIKKIEVALAAYKKTHGYFIQASQATRFYISEDDDEFIKFIDFERMKNKETKVVTDSGGTKQYYVIDAFDTPLIYQCPGTHNTTAYDLVSCGKDGAPGDEVDCDDFPNMVDYADWTAAINAAGDGDDITNF